MPLRTNVLMTLGRLLADRRGDANLTTYMLLTACGAAMVGITAPSLQNSARCAADTFAQQVSVLQQGASPSGGGGGIGGSGWTLNVGANGVSVAGGGISVSAGGSGGSVSAGGVSVSGGRSGGSVSAGGVSVSGGNSGGSVSVASGSAGGSSGGTASAPARLLNFFSL